MQEVELLFENPDTNEIFKYYPSDVSLKTERTPSAAVLSGTIPNVGDKLPPLGATVRLRVDDYTAFLGYLFTCNLDAWNVMSFTAYDVVRYLKNTYSMVYYGNYNPCTVIRDMAKFYDLKVGELAAIPSTGYKLLIENESCLDVIAKLVENATILTGKVYVFYADYDKLCLKSAEDMITDVMIGNESLCTDYSFSSSIDDDTYNQIFLYRESSSVGGRAYRAADDPANVNRWGVLRLTEGCDDSMTNAMMDDKAKKLLEMKNRPFKSMSISALGVLGLRAGMMITIHFPQLLDSVSKSQKVLIDSIEHKFEDGVHTMSLEVRTFWRDTPSTVASVRLFNRRFDAGKWVTDESDVSQEDQKLYWQRQDELAKKRAEAAKKKKEEEDAKKKKEGGILGGLFG